MQSSITARIWNRHSQVSPFEDAAVASVDGFGDFASAPGALDLEADHNHDRVFFPHSLGIFYEALTQFLGFPHYGDEYKVMGLAPYGRPTYLDRMRRIVRLAPAGKFTIDLRFFNHQKGISYQWDDDAPAVGSLFTSELDELLDRDERP